MNAAAAANRAKQKAFRDKRLAAGACTRCGKPRTELPGHTSDEYNPEVLDTGKPRRKASEILYGSLTLEEIRRATSALPLKPPGK